MLVSRPSNLTSARERILDSAEQLFAEKGFSSVTLRDIALPLGLTHASLYYHFPGGKEELFTLVMERNIRRHGEGIARFMEEGGPDIRAKLRGAAKWLLSQPPMDLIRLTESDLKSIDSRTARKLANLLYQLIIGRLQSEIQASIECGQLGPCSAGLIAGAFVGLVESLFATPVNIVGMERIDMAYELIDVLLKGLAYVDIRK